MSVTIQSLISTWRAIEAHSRPPLGLATDLSVVGGEKHSCSFASDNHWVGAGRLAEVSNPRFHLGLVPVLYI